MAASKKTIEVELTGLIYGGDAIGRMPDGRAVFVPFALPGERVKARILQDKKNHVRAELLDVLRPSPDRISPRCRHFGFCGGCHYQHMPYESQLDVKRNILIEQLQRIGGIEQPLVQPVVPSPDPYYYRNTVQFQLSTEGKLGYYEAFQHHVFAIKECHLPEGAINELWDQVDLEPLPGLERVAMRLDSGAEVMIILESSDPEPPEFTVDVTVSAVHLGPEGMVVLSGDDHIVIQVLDRPFYVSPPSFFQINTAQAGAMVRHLLERLPLTAEATVLDVYCGVGLFSAFMAGRVKRLLGVELSPFACHDFATNLDEFDNVELYEGAAEDVLPALEGQMDIVIVDPPRAGLETIALDAIVRLVPAVLAYVSCDPATLGRDAKRLLQAGYRLTDVMPFDLFPQTFHIESISIFEKVGDPAA